ncbi:MAG: ABC transporter permease subunit [bacterium]
MTWILQRHKHIYQRRWHVIFALIVIALPLIFFAFFAHLAHIETAVIYADIGSSLLRLFIAYIIATILGWTLAVMFYRGRGSNIALPAFDVLQSVPTFAALPIAVLTFGKSNGLIIFFLVLAIIWPVFFSVLSSLKMIKGEYHEAVQIYGLRGWKKLKLFVIPASIPGLITGSIVGLGDAWEALVTTEIIVGIGTGFGAFFQQFSNDSKMTIIGIIGLLMIIFTINKMIWLPLLEKSHSLAE